MATEPARGIKAWALRMYDNMPKSFTVCEKSMEYRKAIYGLVWFHALLIERKKFKSLGWNITYAFNDSDFEVCQDLLAVYMGQYVDEIKNPEFDASVPVPW